MPPMTVAAAQLLGRVLMAFLFIRAGLGQLDDPARGIAYITSVGMPLPQVSYYLGLVCMLGAAPLLLIGLQTRLAALILATFCVVTAVVFHYQPGNVAQMTNWVKNLAIAGGMLQLFAVGGGAWSLDAVVGRRKI